MKVKTLKDAIHGYIKLEEPFWKIIDTAEFQRLKWIEQTSYRVLYPSARHDRFIHSLGVFHLGKRAIKGFLNNSADKDKELIQKFRNSFLIACLLHDIGHAPFSHTCEDLYNYKHKMTELDSDLNKEFLAQMKAKLSVGNVFSAFASDYKYLLSPNGKAPSPHEVMSCILVAQMYNSYSSYFKKEDQEILNLDLIVRAIIGCCYKVLRCDDNAKNREIGIKNCLIRLLNSTTVDVDKLDYIARDTQMSGYDNIVLDTERLLSSVCMICDHNVFYPAFKKSALSVITNVVIAKNAQAKWIVNHPIVVYDSYLLKSAIGQSLKALAEIDEKPKPSAGSVESSSQSYDSLIKRIFSSSALSCKGIENIQGHSFALLSDVEILSIMKDNLSLPGVSEYFARNERKGPIWKSYEEFLYCLDADTNKIKTIYDFIVPLITYLEKIKDISKRKQIDDKLYNEICSDSKTEGNDSILDILNVLKNYRNENGTQVEFEYVILSVKNSFSTKISSQNLYIKFGEAENSFSTFDSLTASRTSEVDKINQFFYLYSKSKINAKHFLKYLYTKAEQTEIVRI